MTKKTNEEIEALKLNWAKDPCWDIEDTEGFEEHREELIAWRKDHEWKDDIARKVHADMRFEEIMNNTGVSDREIALALHTFEEISMRAHQGFTEGKLRLISAQQVHATLLQAAQLKRIADALEEIAASESLSETVRIWGSEQ
jgi:hypothetical protein